MHGFTRRFAVGGAIGALALALTACGSGSGESGGGDEVISRTIKVGVAPGSFNSLPAYLAEAEGLNVELVPAGAPATMMPQLIVLAPDSA